MSYHALYHHIVYAVKGRRTLLNADEMVRLCDYTAGIVRNQQSFPRIINGPSDHIHLAVSIDPQVTLPDFVRTLKTNSSRWVHETFQQLRDFAWQDGYAAFTVSHSGLDKVVAYISRQQEHHREMTFEEELAQFLTKHGVKYEKKYLASE
jgi:putative transposase